MSEEMSLPLAITSDQFDSVQKLVDTHFAEEEMSGDNKYKCTTCKALCDGVRRISVKKAPENLIITLKLFQHKKSQNVQSKSLDKKVFLNEKLILEHGSNTSVDYQLYSAIIHSGSTMGRGHYVTACENQPNWKIYNDDVVTESSLRECKRK